MTMIENIGKNALLIIPCCASKAAGGGRIHHYRDPITQQVPEEAISQVLDARCLALRQVRNIPQFVSGRYAKNSAIHAGPDFGGDAAGGRYLRALDRYRGALYSVPGLRRLIEDAVAQEDAPDIMILSALYGPLHPFTPIQDYNLMMGERPARIWGKVFPLFLEDWVRSNGAKEIYLFVGTSTDYYRVAKSAVMRLVDQGLINKAFQFHVADGSTRETPLQHGRLLHALLAHQPMTACGIQVNRIDALAPIARTKPLHPALPWLQDAEGEVDARTPFAGTPVSTQQIKTDSDPAPPARMAAPQQFRVRALPALGSPSNLDADSERFHHLLGRLIGLPMQGLPLSHLGALRNMPFRGIYFFLDKPCTGPQDEHWRVARIGTHAVSAGSKSSLRQRLRAHLGSHSGMGNHRGSIFRLHVGNALLRRAGAAIPTWGIGSVAPSALRTSPELQRAEAALEHQVSAYIGSLGVFWIDVPDEPGPASERALIERNAIALLSNRRRPIIEAAQEWLGHFSTRDEIRTSFLWNLKHVDEYYDPAFLGLLEKAVERTLSTTQA